ncbi:MAG: hypothetical protein A2776_01125 [Candidatus Levybacteria bacterium RIFCSPHIGHO2_01_FULL_40_10]|nr:MAG: hypothetical protein A2776_01125 [Candidatus Levybacteria bacterium RIFCSPHIGHO2_01_FULL_40_10]
MEGASGTPMSAGTPVSVRPSVAPVASEARPAVSAVESVSAGEADRSVKSDLKLMEPVKADAVAADALVDLAKTDGVDHALEKFAQDETGDKTERDIEQDLTQKPADAEGQIAEPKITLKERVDEMRERVSAITEGAGTINPEELNALSLLTLYEMTQLLKMALEGKEQDEDKLSLIEVLFQLVAFLMQQMIVPPEGGVSREERLLEKMGRTE